MPGITKLGIAFFGALLLFACAKEGAETTDEMADTSAMTEPAGMSMASLAGTWNMRVMTMDSDSTVTENQLVFSDSGVTMLREGQEPVPVTAQFEGGTMTADAGPFPSSLRESMVTIHGTYRMEGDMLVGDITAHYPSGPDSVLQLRTEGTRTP